MMENVAIRASSLGELFDCPARWEAKHIRQLRLPTSGAARLGTAVHAGAALFDQSRLDEKPLTIDDCAGAVVDVIYGKDEEVDWDDSSPKEAEKIAVPLHKLYCQEIAPKQNYLAVEALCDDLAFTDIGITLTGTVDRVYFAEDGSLGIADIKTGKTAVAADGTVKTQGHAAQVGVYTLLAGHALQKTVAAPAQIIGLQTAKTDKGRRAAIGRINGALDLLLDDDEKPGMLRLASRLVHSGNFYGNPRSFACGAKYCPVYDICKWRR